MPKVVHRPNLAAVGCSQLTAVTNFRLGRKRLAEDSGLKPTLLLRQPNTLSETYIEGDLEHQLLATLTLVQEGNEAADTWSLELVATGAPRGITKKADSSKRPSVLLRLLGKLAMEVDFYVQAWFVRSGNLPALPKLPVEREYAGGAFSHIVGYTLAKVRELEVLYEVSARWIGGNSYGIGVGFTYHRTLDESIYEEALKRATELVNFVAQPSAETAGTVEPTSPKASISENPSETTGEAHAND